MLAILERSKQPDNIMDSAIATKDSRENIKAEIISWVKAEMRLLNPFILNALGYSGKNLEKEG